MPQKCCAPGCSGNYDNSDSYVSVFKFPADTARRQLWLKRIPRENLQITKNTVICRRHFEDRFVITEDRIVVNGQEIVIKRDRPKLTDDAFPSIFANIPVYLSSSVPTLRRNPADRLAELELRHEQSITDWITSDEIATFSAVCDNFQDRLSDYLQDWNWRMHDEYMCLYIVNFDNVPYVSSCVKILCDLSVCVYINGLREHDSRLVWVLGAGCKLERWSQVENLLSHYKTSRKTVSDYLTLQGTVNLVCDMLTDQLVEFDATEFDAYDDCGSYDVSVNVACVKLCIEQLRLACSSPYSRQYSNDMLQFAFTLFVRSSSCYRILLDSNTLILPQPRNLQKLSAVFNFSPGIQSNDHEQMRYLKFKADGLSQREKFVVLQVDEMHVTQGFNYKGGRITGVAENSKNDQANAIQAFLISSVAGSMREIVALVPVKQSTSATLTDMIKQVIRIVQACGFVVVIVASDNNQINAKAFEQLCGSDDVSVGIPNPDYPQYKIFLIFDIVHILKCIRNNWLNQKDSNQTFIYPQPCPVYRPSSSCSFENSDLAASCSTAVSTSSSSSDTPLQSHSSSNAMIKPTVEQSQLPPQLVTVFMPVLVNGSAIMMPVVVPFQLPNSAQNLPPEQNDGCM